MKEVRSSVSERYVSPVIRYEFTLRSPTPTYLAIKRALDVVVASVGLVAFAPLLLAVAVLVRLSGRPILFRQTRIGLGGQPFTVLKFRSMHVTADPYARKPEDAAASITRAGRLIRTLGLDELPQLLNVLRGDMTLVGPRPEMPFVVDGYDRIQRMRLEVKPGVTGIWQLSPVRKRPIHDNIEYDLFYLAHRTLLMDLWIIARTPVLLLFGKHLVLDRRLAHKWQVPHDEVRGPRVVLDLTDTSAELVSCTA